MVLFLFLNDFLTMSLSTDRMGFSRRPNRWNTRGILLAATVLAACKLVFSLGVFLAAITRFGLDMPHLQTLTFVDLDPQLAGRRLSPARAGTLLAVPPQPVSSWPVRSLV